MKLSELYPPRFISGKELTKPLQITIARVIFEDCFNQKRNETVKKPVVYPMGAKRGFILTKTIAQNLIKILGDIDTSALTGKIVTIYSYEHKSTANLTDAQLTERNEERKIMICVKAASPAAAATATKPAQPPPAK